MTQVNSNWIAENDIETKAAFYVWQQASTRFHGGLKKCLKAAQILYTEGKNPDAAVACLISDSLDPNVGNRLQQSVNDGLISEERLNLAKEVRCLWQARGNTLERASDNAKLIRLAYAISGIEKFNADPGFCWGNFEKGIKSARWVQSAVSMRNGKETAEQVQNLKDAYQDAAKDIERTQRKMAEDIQRRGNLLHSDYQTYLNSVGIDAGLDQRFEKAMDRAQDMLAHHKKKAGFNLDDPVVATQPVPRFTPKPSGVLGWIKRSGILPGYRVA